MLERDHRRLIGAGMEGKGSESLACLAPEVPEKRAYGGTQKPYCNEDKFWSEDIHFMEGQNTGSQANLWEVNIKL